MKKTVIGLCVMLMMGACQQPVNHHGRTPMAELNGEYLYLEDFQSVTPAGLSSEDSVLFAEKYIRTWAEDVLLFGKAKQNIPNSDELKKLVENYRKALILHTYQQELIHQQLTEEVTEQEMLEYYEQNQNLFKLEQPLMKGLFIKVPLKAPQLANVRKWYKTETDQAVEHLEKYSLQNAVKYEYFYDRWLPVPEVLDQIAPNTAGLALKKGKQIELKDTAFYYFLNVTDYRDVGEHEPFEFARDKIKEMLLNMKQVEFMKKVKTHLYQEAIAKDKIKYYIDITE